MAMDTQNGNNDVQAMMEAYHKHATTGTQHKLLANMEGSWNTSSKSWLEPGKPPVESTGACEQKMILGGRFLQMMYSGDMMGQPFNGIGVTGYDNQKQKYVSTWMDSMSTSIFLFEGTGDTEGQVITQECQGEDPVRGPMTWRSVTKVVDHDTHLFEMYGTVQGGKEEKMMEITYTRKS